MIIGLTLESLFSIAFFLDGGSNNFKAECICVLITDHIILYGKLKPENSSHLGFNMLPTTTMQFTHA